MPASSETLMLFRMPDAEFTLASGSPTRAQMLTSAGMNFHIKPALVDEDALKGAGLADGISHTELAIMLADVKASSVATATKGYVLGCDQILSAEGAIFSKPETIEHAAQHLQKLQGQTHQLLTAAVLYFSGQRIWHHISTSSLQMRSLSEQEIEDYLNITGDAALSSPGCYQIESTGIHLFNMIDGDMHDILGLPLLPLLQFLRARGLHAAPATETSVLTTR